MSTREETMNFMQKTVEPGTSVVPILSIPEIAKAIAAFSNTGGGRVLIGVGPDGAVIGVPNLDIKQLEAKIQQKISPRVRISVVQRPLGDRMLVLIDVAAGSEQPYVVGNRIYVWRSSRVQAATPDEISDMIVGRAEHGRRWEREISLGVGLYDLDDRQLNQSIEAAFARSVSVRSTADPLDFLQSTNLADGEQLHNAAVVLFAKNPARVMPQTRVKIASFADTERTKFLDNKTLEGNMFDLFDDILSFIDRHISIRSSFDNYTRKDQLSIPPFVVREAVMNALVHRDYQQINGNVMVAIHPDRLEVWNPGNLPEGVTPESLPRAKVSRPHNPDIANVAFLRGMIEQWGSGTRRIVSECRNAGLPEPHWEEVGGGVRLTVFTTQERSQALNEILNERAIRFARESFPGQRISLEQYHAFYAPDVSARTARRDLNELTQLGYLEIISDRPGIYTRTDRSI